MKMYTAAIFLIVAVALGLIACTDSASNATKTNTDITLNYSLPAYMQNCSISQLKTTANVPDLTVTYCPHADVSTEYLVRQGKTTVQKQTITINGIEYQATGNQPTQ